MPDLLGQNLTRQRGLLTTRGSTLSYTHDPSRLNVDSLNDTARSISGPDLVAMMTLPGFGRKVFAELATISYSTNRDPGWVWGCGSVGARGLVRGPRAVAGTLVFIQFDRNAVLEILDYTKNPGSFLGRYRKLLQQQRWTELSRQISILNRRMENISKVAQSNDISVSLPYHETESFDVEYFRAHQEGGDTGSSLVVIGEEIARLEREYVDSLKLIRDKRKRDDQFRSLRERILPDSLPPFDVTLVGANEAGVAVRGGVFGVQILTDGSVMSIEDLVMEETMTYGARDILPVDSMSLPDNTNPDAGLGMGHISKQVENLENEISRRIVFIRQLQQRQAEVDASLERRKSLVGSSRNLFGFNYRIFFVGALSATFDFNTQEVIVSWSSQTQNNLSVLRQDLFPQSKIGQYELIVQGGEFAVAGDPGAQTVKLPNINNEPCAAAKTVIPADQNIENTGDIYEVSIGFDEISDLISASSGRIKARRTYRIAVSFLASVPYSELIDTEDEAKAYREQPPAPDEVLVSRRSNTIATIKRAGW